MGRKKQQRVEPSGPMAGNVRRGRRFFSPIAAMDGLVIANWVRDDLPDLIWPILVLADSGTDAGKRFVQWQRSVQDDLRGEVDIRELSYALDGRLTSLDRLVSRAPHIADKIRRRAMQFELVPDHVSRIVHSYLDPPSTWLFPGEFAPIDQAGANQLAKSMFEVVSDGHREAIIKCLWIWSAVQAGQFSSSADTIELLKDYPIDPTTRNMADSAVRAMWGANRLRLLHDDESHFDATADWARRFWISNSVTTACIRGSITMSESEEAVSSNEDAPEPESDTLGPARMPTGTQHYRRFAMDLLSSYVEALENSPSDLYNAAFHEVNSGLVARASREVIAALGAPDLWGMEHGSHVIRILIETRIYVEWMSRQEPSIYDAFKSYGQGKAKLYAKISEEVQSDINLPGFDEAINEFRRLGHDDEILEHRVVDTSDSFSGKSIRTMAEEADLLDLYRRAYSVASGASHSEWWSIETHCMQQCGNILHGGHLIPSLHLASEGNAAVADSWLDTLYALMMRSLEILKATQESVDEAFAWMRASPESAAGSEPEE